jgi:hypothetical protein
MKTVSPNQLLQLANATFAAGRFLFITGQGGGGKTSIACNEISRATGRECWLVNLCGQGPQEVIGYGVPQPNGDMRFSAPTIWPTFDRVGHKPVLLVLDELPDYDPEVRALLRGLYPASGTRYVGPHKLGHDVAIVVTGNRRCDGTRSAVEDAPFTERSIKVQLEPTVSDWLDWYDNQPELIKSGSHVPAFLRFGNTSGDGLDHFNPPVRMPYDGEPHPCPRTWEAVALLTPFRAQDPEVFKAAVVGSVGERAAAAFFGFLSHVDRVPDIAQLKANPDSFTVPSDPAAQFALVSACLATATRGVRDVPAALHGGGFDWLCSLLLRCRGDVRSYGARSAVRRGIPLDQHRDSCQLLLD